MHRTVFLTVWLAASVVCADTKPVQVRFATFNASLNRREPGQLVQDLRTRDNPQVKAVAESIQRVRPQVILINEFDFDEDGDAMRLFHDNYLAVGQNGHEPLRYPYRFAGGVNTGVASGRDLNKDGELDGPGDALGFGFFPGQYGMVVYSKFPIDREHVRTFRKFLWKDMPGARLPVDPTTGDAYYSPSDLDVMRLSSKSHWDLPLQIDGETCHLLCAHPTPPVFDGPEDRNGRRNHDEIRLWADYVDAERSAYLHDDTSQFGGLPAGARFVIAGDMNSDPLDGDSLPNAIRQLLDHRLIDSSIVPTSGGAIEQNDRQGGVNQRHKTDPASDTSDFSDAVAGNLRLDYLLPSKTLRPVAAGVFWPRSSEPGADLVRASDHRLVWADIELPRRK